MAFPDGPDRPDADSAGALDEAAQSLLSIWDRARERAATQLSGSQLRALLVVEQRPGINLRRLAEQLGMMLSSASRLCDRLVAAGVLDRVPGRSDRREIALHLTPAGQGLVGGLREERRRQLAAVLARMSPAARTALLRGLQDFAVAAAADGGTAERSAPAAG